MSRLQPLRTQLGRLRRGRQSFRLGIAAASLVILVVGVLAAVYVLDFGLQLSRLQRLVVIVAAGAVLVWGYRRWVARWLGQDESDLDMALLLEREQKIDSDLVAALQFEAPQAASWGSQKLETAVIDYVAEFSQSMDVFAGFSRRPLFKRAAVVAALLVVLLVFGIGYPGHLAAFANRLFLGSAHYPTATRIERIAINGQQVFPATPNQPLPRVPYGQPLRFEVSTSGETATAAHVALTNEESLDSLLPLAAPADQPHQWAAQLPRLLHRVSYQVFAGDAWTDPSDLEVVALPVVTVELATDVPNYANSGQRPLAKSAGAQQLSVVEGSRVTLVAHCSNKPLESAVLTIGDQEYPLTQLDPSAQQWSLTVTDSPLTSVVAPLRYSLQVTDVDGLQLAEPLAGSIRLQMDRPPRVRAVMTTMFVLPTANPKLRYEAADDFGVARLRLHRETIPQQGEPRQDVVDIPLSESPTLLINGRWPVSLDTLALVKGDQVKLTLEAIDYRGSTTGKGTFSDPLVLQVTDERGVLANMAESDEQSAKQLDAIIQRQLGIGGSE